MPRTLWRDVGFATDTEWTTATAPIGYGDDDDQTVLEEMRDEYTSVFLRHAFEVSDPLPETLILRLYVDDGVVVWINGIEIARRYLEPGELPYNTTAAIHEAEWEKRILFDAAAYLRPGSNVLAVQAFNQAIGSSDFSIDAELSVAGVGVTQVEAVQVVEIPQDSGNVFGRFLPQVPLNTDPMIGESFAGRGLYDGKEFIIKSVSRQRYDFTALSSHARTVGNYFYGNGSSLGPTVSTVNHYDLGNYLASGFLRFGSGAPPAKEDQFVQNHSWIAGSGEEEEPGDLDYVRLLRRVDYAVEQEGFVCVGGVNNGVGTAVPAMMASAYNVIIAGRSDGNHGYGLTGSLLDGPGRTKPDLVVPLDRTSWAAAAVSSAAALLVEEMLVDGAPAADGLRPEVVKALLMAGATKEEFPQWSRSELRPLDPVYGTGELHIGNSGRIYQEGRQTTQSGLTERTGGWDFGRVSQNQTRTYRFQVPAGERAIFSGVICWNRMIENSSNQGFEPTPVPLADLRATLVREKNPLVIQELQRSDSEVDNVEHIYHTDLEPGIYRLEVRGDASSESNFGLAWRTTSLPGPTLTARIEDQAVFFTLSGFSEGVDYVIQSSSDLESWTEEQRFVGTASDLESAVDRSSERGFRYYRVVR